MLSNRKRPRAFSAVCEQSPSPESRIAPSESLSRIPPTPETSLNGHVLDTQASLVNQVKFGAGSNISGVAGNMGLNYVSGDQHHINHFSKERDKNVHGDLQSQHGNLGMHDGCLSDVSPAHDPPLGGAGSSENDPLTLPSLNMLRSHPRESSYSSSSAIDTDAYAAYSLFSVNNTEGTTSPVPSLTNGKKKRTSSLPQLPQVKCFYNKLTSIHASLPPKVGKVTAEIIDHPDNLPPCDDKKGHFIVRENENFAGRYTVVKELGQGTFGKVVQCYDKVSRKHVAIKIIRNIQKYRDAARIELRVLSTIKHVDSGNSNHCIHLRECLDYRGHICFVTELLQILLYDFLDKNRFLAYPGSHIQAFGKQLIRSVAFLHDLNLIHTDLKPENILLHDDSFTKKTIHSRTILAGYAHLSRVEAAVAAAQADAQAALSSSSSLSRGCSSSLDQERNSQVRVPRKLRILQNPLIQVIDFGSAVFDDESHSPVVSTRHYRAPEIVLGIGWLFPCDMWSIGCILAELAIGEPLFRTHENIEHLAMIEKICGQRIDKHLVHLSQLKCPSAGSAYFTAPVAEPSAQTSLHNLGDLFAAPEHGTMMLTDDDDDGEVIFDSKSTYENAQTLRYPLSITSKPSMDRVGELSRIDIFISRRLGLDINFDYTLSHNYDCNLLVMDFGNFTFWWFYLDLLRKLLVVDPAKRMTASAALNHPWFNLGVEDEGTI